MTKIDFGLHFNLAAKAKFSGGVKALKEAIDTVIEVKFAQGLQLRFLNYILNGGVDQLFKHKGSHALLAEVAHNNVARCLTLTKALNLGGFDQLPQRLFVGFLHLVSGKGN